MSTKIEVHPQSDKELVICRLLDISPEAAYRGWTDTSLLKKWFCPKPWSVKSAELDVRVGGACTIVMNGPEGQEIPCPGVYLELIPNQKIVFTDAYVKAWEPSSKPFITAIITFENQGGKTKYTARVQHWSVEDRDAHAKMGFLEGWAICADQLEALMKKQ